jgi:hypothetical protein
MNEACADAVIEENVRLLRERSVVGVTKYGTTLANDNASMAERLKHLRLELLDGANYVTWALAEIERLQRRSDALEIAREYVERQAARGLDSALEALTAIAATTAQAGEDRG